MANPSMVAALVQLGQESDSSSRDTPHEGHQNEAASLDSKYKAIWDAEMGAARQKSFSYRKVAVLLLAWHPTFDDLNTKEEIDRLQNLFVEAFHFDIVRKTLTHDGRPAQAQVNFHLSEFVYQHGDTHALLIVYYAGHGRPGESSGDLRLPGRQDLIPKDSGEVHEIIWNSAENNIRYTQCDVLLIFDCCHAGELERGVRGTVVPRAFEYLAATSADSTTRRPGKNSFTTALIWAFKELLGTANNSFTTQDLVAKVLQAPDFPQGQYPRLSERGPSCTRKIILAPLDKDKGIVTLEQDEQITPALSPTTDLSLRFVFKEKPTERVVKELAVGLRRFINENDFKTSTVLWDGLDTKYREAISHFYGHRWLRNFHARKKSQGAMVVSLTTPSIRVDTAVAGMMAVDMNSHSAASPARKEMFLDSDGNAQDHSHSGSDTGVDTPLSAASGMEPSGLRRSPRGSQKRKRGAGSN